VKFTSIALSLCFSAAGLAGCGQTAGTYGYAGRTMAPVSYQRQPDIQPWCAGDARQAFPQCGGGY